VNLGRPLVIVKPRTAELVLVTQDGECIGGLSAVPVPTPWWQDVEPVVTAARKHHGIDVVILRLLGAELGRPHGGRVTYLAEVAKPVPARRWAGVLAATVERRRSRFGPRSRFGSACSRRRRAAGGHLSQVPRQYRAVGASLPPRRSGAMAETNGRPGARMSGVAGVARRATQENFYT